MALKELPIAKTIDVKGQICPYPIIATRVALKDLKIGDVLEVVTDNPPTANETLPQLCEIKHYDFERIELAGGIWRCLVRKGE